MRERDAMKESDIVGRVPREMRTPITDAFSALCVAWEFWIEMSSHLMADNPNQDYGENADPETFFLNNFFKSAWDDPATNGDKLVDEIRLSADEIGLPLDGEYASNNIAHFALIQVMIAAVAYAVQVMKAEKNDKHNEAWTFAADAKYWAGILQAAWAAKMDRENPAAELAKKRHAEHYAMIEDAVQYWRDNIDKNLSASKAANELIRVVPLSHKKLAEVIAAEKKKRS
ncbi:MAG: hypothetical protein HC889_12760 [Synechococcaceae cyanobacterium SM1_2_3]|nr:hypothetical protein [Synechococcaceae cyanobacterium SM1_2_3]